MPLDPSIILKAGDIPKNALEAQQQAFNLGQSQINAPLERAQKQASLAQTQQTTANANTSNQANQLALASAKLSAIGGLMNGVTDQPSYTAHLNAGIQAGLIPPEYANTHAQYDPVKLSGYIDTLAQQKERLDLATKQADISMKQAHANFFNNGGTVPAAVKISNAMRNAAANGDWDTVNSIAIGGKLLEKGQLLGPDNFNTFLSSSGLSDAQNPTPTQTPSSTNGYKISVMPGAKEAASALAEGKESGKATPKYSAALDNDAKQAINMHLTIGAMRDALDNFQSGASAPARAVILRYAKAAGIPVNENSLNNQQVFAKLANDVVAQAAKAEGGASRLAAAYNGLVQANPNASLEPGALKVLLDKMDAQAGLVTTMQQKWNEEKKLNPNLTGADFERNYLANVAAEQEKAGGGMATYPGSQNPYIAPGTVRVSSESAPPGSPNAALIQQGTGKPVGGINIQALQQKTLLAKQYGYTDAEIKAHLARQR